MQTPLKFRELLAGTRAAVLSETRRTIESVRRLAATLGLGELTSRQLGQAIAVMSWLGVFTGIFVGVFAPPIRSIFNLQTSVAKGATLGILAFGLWTLASLDVRCHRRHARFMMILSRSGRCGFRLGHVFSAFPLILIAFKQSLYLQGYVKLIVLLFVFFVGILLAISGRSVSTWLVSVVRVGALILGAIVLLRYTSIGMLILSVLTDGIVKALLGLIVSALVAVATTTGAIYLAKTRLGPRESVLHRRIGILAGSTLAGTLSLSLLVNSFNKFAYLADLLLVTGVIFGILLLRVKAARFVNPEALGLGLFFARDTNIDGEKIVRYYRANWVFLASPLMFGGLILLVHSKACAGAVLLVSLAVLEIAIEELAVQRRTTVLPASAITSLGVSSLSGMGAGIGLTILLSASGATGLTPAINLQRNIMPIVIASVLFLLVSSILLVLRTADSSRWLSSLSYTLRSGGRND